jgi:hypothetical protein
VNIWTKISIDYANQKNYLDDLFRVYPTIPEGIRDIDKDAWIVVEKAFKKKDNIKLLKNLLKFKLFPIKDSYVAYLRRDCSALERNPNTVNRLAGRLYEMGLNKIYESCSQPKETNRQIGPLFKRWVNDKSLGIIPVSVNQFLKTKENAILDASDAEMMSFANEKLGYNHNKGLDFIARFNGKYIIGEVKFLTDFGGHQNAQFNDAVTTIKTKKVNAIKIAILDGVVYIKSNNKMYKSITGYLKKENIMSALVLREFLYQI